MIYDGKQAALAIQSDLKKKIESLQTPPKLAIVSVTDHPSIQSFIKIKRAYAEDIGVVISEYNFQEEQDESHLILELEKLSTQNAFDGIIVQLPLPVHYDTQRVLDAIPQKLDIDVLGKRARETFLTTGLPLPPVVGAVAHICRDAQVTLESKKIVVVGRGRLVGKPVTEWLLKQGLTLDIVDIETSEQQRLAFTKKADIIISGSGVPHLIKPEHIKEGVVLIDAGTSEQAGVLAGDCDPACEDKASLITPVPGGVGPLTVAYLFKNLVDKMQK